MAWQQYLHLLEFARHDDLMGTQSQLVERGATVTFIELYLVFADF